ncbi:MAG TPA: hypothetical protein VGL56_18265 [Fimbriimonadaceae bacterium]|jgi:hypothetical protein
MEDLSKYPGGDLVAKGLIDLKKGTASEEALLVCIASNNVKALGFDVPALKTEEPSYEIALYTEIENREPDGAHSAYNALVDRVDSFIRCYKKA